ncbi:MAG: DoxX family protein [Candidatus Liptonbacteria bacterium RIFCSPLOWO2_01_FULL_45_15]|uniref:DoxX family protein n=1 Tax=Candidatus Liptonbacteria bacterium RIFCSPLOWO2_01_FULL_45_15 TaxID=1798649 RepID=A0A1G2CEP6_9BACT|nr:MAG: DoxX family protein [Candidatus Liptonbacteria bacterium RIFCSPLOWO2_01_FULL_45_15]
MRTTINLPEPKAIKFLFTDTRASWFWLLLRLYLGYEWLMAGWAKFTDENGVWVGAKAGTAVTGFLNRALQKTTGEHPDVSGWYAWFIQNVALPHPVIFSYLIVFGEIAVGLGLIVGLFTALAAFFGVVMNFNFLFAGTVSVNPIMLLMGILIVLAWRTCGYLGLDYFRTERRLR